MGKEQIYQIAKIINDSPLSDIFVDKNYLQKIVYILTLKGKFDVEDLKHNIISMTGDYSDYVDYEAEELANKLWRVE